MLTQKSMAFLAMGYIFFVGCISTALGLSFFSRKLVRSKGTPSCVWAKFTRGITTDRPKNREMGDEHGPYMRIKLPLGHPQKKGIGVPKMAETISFRTNIDEDQDEYIWYTVDGHIWQSLNEFQTAFKISTNIWKLKVFVFRFWVVKSLKFGSLQRLGCCCSHKMNRKSILAFFLGPLDPRPLSCQLFANSGRASLDQREIVDCRRESNLYLIGICWF